MFGSMLENMMMPRESWFKHNSYAIDMLDDDVMDALPQDQQDKYIETQLAPQVEQQMKDLVENYSKRDYSNDSCFVCFIMSHGDNGKILCSDEMLIDLKKDIIKPFQMSKTLVNKPKLFFIQACRGDNVMPNI